MNIDINSAGVISTGQEMTELAEDTSTKVGSSLDSSETAADDHPGWQSSSALWNCADAWEKHVSFLVYQVGQLGQDLMSSGQSYSDTDAEAERRLLEVLNEMHKS